jgi:hypothetical protein
MEGQPLIPSRLADAKPYLDQLKQGFAGVVPHGTGRCCIKLGKPLEQRLFAKTGTATIAAGVKSYSSWVVGWVEPAAGSGIKSRLAFACWVSKSSDFGAPTCGSMITHILQALDKPS